MLNTHPNFIQLRVDQRGSNPSSLTPGAKPVTHCAVFHPVTISWAGTQAHGTKAPDLQEPPSLLWLPEHPGGPLTTTPEAPCNLVLNLQCQFHL